MSSNGHREMGTSLIYNYKDNNVYRNSFNQLATLVFGIDFEDWYQKGRLGIYQTNGVVPQTYVKTIWC